MKSPVYPVLMVDDDPQGLESARRILELEGYRVHACGDGQAALDWVRARTPLPESGLLAEPFVVVSDVRMPKLSGLEFLAALKAMDHAYPVVLMTAFGQVEDAVQAMKLGAVDFLSKPFKRQTLLDAIHAAERRIVPRPVPGEAAATPHAPLGLVGSSPLIERVRTMIRQVAPTSAAVLITGESGTGKERVARALHAQSLRAKSPFIAWNCAAVPENLVESELFGYERGAFTGATAAHGGLFEAAHGGTLFMDEIGDMPLLVQAKLLRVLQEGEVRRLGATQSRKVDVRIVAATHRDLQARVQAGLFREDLLYRLEVIRIEMPALRDRSDDLPDLILELIRELGQKHSKEVTQMSEAALSALLAHRWPGNIRELSNALERALVFSDTDRIELRALPAHLLGASSSTASHPSEEAGSEGSDALARALQARLRQTISITLGTPLREVEDLLIRRTLEATSGDKLETARLLGINSRTIYRRLEKGAEPLSDSDQSEQLKE